MSNQTSTSPQLQMAPIVNWVEIPVSDLARATTLYAAMLDSKLEQVGTPAEQMVLLGANGCLLGGAKAPSPKGGTVVYLNAKDGVKACLSRAVEAGAKVVQPETSIGPHGTIAKIEDFDGNIVGLHAELAR